jgi:hypothetical protein
VYHNPPNEVGDFAQSADGIDLETVTEVYNDEHLGDGKILGVEGNHGYAVDRLRFLFRRMQVGKIALLATARAVSMEDLLATLNAQVVSTDLSQSLGETTQATGKDTGEDVAHCFHIFL